jgi:hypothetical protein
MRRTKYEYTQSNEKKRETREASMLKKENLHDVDQWIKSYRRVQFPGPGCEARKVARLAEAIENNCAATIRFADGLLREPQDDGEELFYLCSLRQNAMSLRRACRALAVRQNGSNRPRINYEFVTLRSQYDTLISSLRHFFFLLDRDLAGRIHGAL